jgi:hypothetical protein
MEVLLIRNWSAPKPPVIKCFDVFKQEGAAASWRHRGNAHACQGMVHNHARQTPAEQFDSLSRKASSSCQSRSLCHPDRDPHGRRLPTNYEAAEKNIQLQQATSFRPLDGSRHVRSSRRLFPMAVVQLVAGFLSAEFECEGTSDKGCLRYEGTV